MKFFDNLPFAIKLGTLVGVPLLGLGAFALTSFDTVNKVKISGQAYTSIIQDKDLLADILPPPAYIVESHLVAMQMHDATGAEDVRNLAKRMAQLRSEYNARIDVWTKDLKESSLKSEFLEASQRPAQQYFSVALDEFVPALLAGDEEKADEVFATKLVPSFEQHRASIDKVVSGAIEKAKDDEAAAVTLLHARNSLLWWVAGGVGLGTILLGWTISRGVTRPLNTMAGNLNDICAGTARLAPSLDADRKDELGNVARSANSLISRLAEFIASTKQASQHVMSGAGELQELAANSNDQIERMSDRAREVASAMTEMSASASEVASQAQLAANAAEDARKAAVTGGGTVQSTIDGMGQVEQAVARSTDSVAALGQRSEAIGRMIEMINDIADQTNLLALNAAIEAARAGEHGRGFAVVADEVRKLADRTAKATSEVRESITQIQAETTNAGKAMTQGVDLVRSGLESASRAGEDLTNIVRSSEHVTSMIGTIATAAAEQSATTQQVSQALEEIAGITNQTQKATADSQAAIQTLAQRAADLSRLVDNSGLKIS